MNRFISTNRRRGKAGGFSLIEVVIAVAIVGLSFLAILATLSVGITNDQASSQQTAATNIAASIVADLRSTPSYATPPNPTSQRYSIGFPTVPVTAATPPAPLAGATPVVLYFDNQLSSLTAGSGVPASAIYAAHVYLALLSSTPQPTYVTRIVVSWPAQAPTPAGGSGPLYVGNVDVVTQFISHGQ